MNKKIILGLIAVIIIAVAVGAWLIIKPNAENQIKISPAEKSKTVGEASYGWSINNDPAEAAKEAVAMMKLGLGGKSPKYVFFSFGIGKGNIGYDPNKLATELKNQLGPNVKIHGMSSSIGVLTNDGFHSGEVGSLAIMGIASDRMDFGVAGISLDGITPKEAGKKAIQAAIKNASKQGLPQIVYVTAAPGAEEDILPGIEEVLGTDIPVIGGSAGDNNLTGQWYEITNDQVYKNGLVLTVFYTDLKVGYAYEHSYDISENKGIVTKASGRILYEIDNLPAAEVYNEWTGGRVEAVLQKGGSIVLDTAAFYPLARAIKGSGGNVFYISIMPASVNVADKSLNLLANVEVGDEISMLHGTWEVLANRALSTPKEALESKAIRAGQGLFGIYTYCAGTLFVLPEAERPKLSIFVDSALGGIPFIGGFTLGEQIFLPGVGDRQCNLVNSMIVFGE